MKTTMKTTDRKEKQETKAQARLIARRKLLLAELARVRVLMRGYYRDLDNSNSDRHRAKVPALVDELQSMNRRIRKGARGGNRELDSKNSV